MTSVIILADTHLEAKLPERLVEAIRTADMILHAGDFVSREAYNSFQKFAHFEAVQGNADSAEIKKLLPRRKVLEVDDFKIGLVHQASYAPNLVGANMLAREMNVQVLVFGHLHRPLVERKDRLLLCPGSPTIPRMSPPTIAELIIEDGKVNGKIIPLGAPVCDYLRHAESLVEGRKR
jgi:putative phosphoesterase